MLAWREDLYKWLSRFAHAHPIAHYINAHSFADESGEAIGPAWGGMRDALAQQTLNKAASYSWLTARQLGSLLANVDHGWYAFAQKRDTERSWIAYLWEFMNRYFLARYADWSKSVE